jgi:hypothetical protein
MTTTKDLARNRGGIQGHSQGKLFPLRIEMVDNFRERRPGDVKVTDRLTKRCQVRLVEPDGTLLCRAFYDGRNRVAKRNALAYVHDAGERYVAGDPLPKGKTRKFG